MLAPAVPELFESETQSVIDIRTESLQTLRELGPPDLVRLTKRSNKSSSKEVGVYHHVTGVDASSSASLAAYVNTLTWTPHDKSFKVTAGLYCCYNAFSRLDMRVHVSIPGSVESYCVDERGNQRTASEMLWLETYLCSVLRAYGYADDGSGEAIKKIMGMRRFNPITNTDAEHRFLEAAERLFFNGWQLGSDPEVQVPSLVSNHLTTGIMNYINTTGRYASGINLFEKLRIRDPEISSLLARVFIAADEEVKAVQLLHTALKELPMDHALLDCQAYFCNLKGRSDLALEIAKTSVVSAPSEFGTWSRLAEVYIALEQWDLALLTLNSCPMFTYQDKDAPRFPTPERVALHAMPESVCDEIEDANLGDIELVQPQLRKLVAAGFKGTFLKAYLLLTEITKKIGWEQVLKIRSNVFVMEEEYRQERHVNPNTSKNASTVTLTGTPPKSQANGNAKHNDEAAPATSSRGDGDSSNEDSVEVIIEPPTPTKPTSSVALDTGRSDGEDESKSDAKTNSVDPSHKGYTSFRHKRLCERWLDNLFMILYEDLRVYTMWRTEVAQCRTQQLPYKKSAEEWEIYGDLAQRLHYEDEAAEAWQQCLAQRFSPRAMKGVLKVWERQSDTKGIAGAVIRLICWQFRWFSEFSPSLFHTVRKLIEDEGALKIRSIIQATDLPQHVLDLTHHYTAICATFRSNGSGDIA